MALALALVLHAHQPAGNFDAVIEQTYRDAYLPFLESAAARPWFRFSLHFSGFLLDWLGEHHPGYLDRLRQLVAADRLELLGGGYYEPILAAIPPEDQQEQLARLAAALERHFGLRPRGAWLAERVWEPELPPVLARAGLAYTLLDDAHFESAGLPAADLHGYWLTESQGESLAVAPSNYFLRQAIPFRPETDSFGFLEEQARLHPGSLLVMGDDLEKFGAWPHTHQHVYRDGWLDRFLDGLESRHRQALVTTVRLGDYLASHPARGLVYLPSGSYPEMMRWAGNASWRGFLSKYREANLLHKTLWDLTRRRRQLPSPANATEGQRHAQAWTHLLAAECNDVYWHGWFGGLYSPHLRNLAFSHLLAADALLAPASPSPAQPRRFDLRGEGRETIELRGPELRLLLSPSDGACLEEIDLLPARANCVHTIQRRPEPYHAALRQPAVHNPANLPRAPAAAAPLEDLLLYDPFPRLCGRLYLCPPDKGFGDFERLNLEPDLNLAAGPHRVLGLTPEQVTLTQGPLRKTYTLRGRQLGVDIALDPLPAGAPAPLALVEMVFNLLAPDAEDRYLELAGVRRGLRWAGELPPLPLTLRDGWRGFSVCLDAPGARAWWIQPLFTVSQSESGFEAIYQGSVLAAVWAPGTRQFALTTNFFL